MKLTLEIYRILKGCRDFSFKDSINAEYQVEITGCLVKYPENKQVAFTKLIHKQKISDNVLSKADDSKEANELLIEAALKISNKMTNEINSRR